MTTLKFPEPIRSRPESPEIVVPGPVQAGVETVADPASAGSPWVKLVGRMRDFVERLLGPSVYAEGSDDITESEPPTYWPCCM